MTDFIYENEPIEKLNDVFCIIGGVLNFVDKNGKEMDFLPLNPKVIKVLQLEDSYSDEYGIIFDIYEITLDL